MVFWFTCIGTEHVEILDNVIDKTKLLSNANKIICTEKNSQ